MGEMMPKKICVTGAAGKAGRVAVRELLDHGYEVLATDIVPHPPVLPAANSRPDFSYLRGDLTDYGDAVEILAGVSAVVHLANIPAPQLLPPARTFTVNTAMNSNVFLAAIQDKLDRVVWASSETTLGLDFETPPRYAPLDEDHYPLPTTTYSLSKVVGETMATHLAEWSGIPFVALRLSNVLYVEDYEQFPQYWRDPALRKWNLWSYIDARDAALACRLALEADLTGARSYIIANADTVMTTPSRELLAGTFPGVKLTREVGEFETLMSIDRARRELGYEPQHSWRDHVQPPA
jgi:nucleoside-diphosphate-sugar epimerase